MKSGTSGIGGFAVLTVVLTCLAVQAVFTLPAYGDEIVGWGSNEYGQLDAPAGNDFIAVAAGGGYGIALKADGSIVGWGRNYEGQTDTPAGNDFIAISACSMHSLALESGGSIVGWGKDTYQQISRIPSGDNFIAIAAGRDHNLALRNDGSIVGWGLNTYGQATPPDETDFVAVAAGYYHSLALKSDGSIVCWGAGEPGDPYNFGQAVSPLENDFTAIAAGTYHSLALKSDASIVCWGYDYWGQATAPSGNDFTAVAADYLQSLALKSDGSIVGWGLNVSGQTSPPTRNDFTAVAAGAHFSLALVSTNTPPVADAGGPYLASVGQTIVLDGSYSYDDDGDFLSYLWTQADNLGSFDVASSESPNYTGSQAGITDLTVTVSDGEADNSDTTMLIVYDPSGGFVTGGGWIWSPAGAYVDDPLLEGKANFGFVSKYKKGAEVPTGQTEFKFEIAGLDFHSSSYDWLVVNQNDSNAQFKGSGTINGSGDYKFMLWAGDGELDTLRIKIWEEDDAGIETIVYDNHFEQVIEGGSIVVHTK